MAKKNRKKHQRDVPQSELARRLLEKGQAKVALKEAKRCFRQNPNDDHRELLEIAYLARVEQLHRMRQLAEAKVVLAELCDFKPTTPQVTAKLARFQIIVGDTKANADALLKDDPLLLIVLVDQAVLHESTCLPDDDDVSAQVASVRDALAAVERGEDDAAAQRLASISRTSPLADWRLFVRGLSAFYDEDEERTQKNWERLDANRPASRIARTLLASAGAAGTDEPHADLADGLHRLQRYHQVDPAIGALTNLVAAWKESSWSNFFRQYRSMCQRFAQSRETMLRQIADFVWKRAVHEADYDMLTRLSKIGPAPEIDPHWHRAKALLSEHPRGEESIDKIEAYWLALVSDLSKLECLPEEERKIAVGLVYRRLGRNFTQYADQPDVPSFFSYIDPYEQKALRADAARHYRQSIKVCPQLHDSYLELAALYEADEEPGKAAKIMEKLARQDPDCFHAVIWLAHYYLSQDDPGKSERHVEAARRLRPRDANCLALTWYQRVTMIRCLAIKRQFEAARQEIESAAQAVPEQVEPYTLDLLRAGVEYKAKNVDAAQAHVEAALAKVEQPVCIWLQMSSVAARMRVAREFKKEYDDRFKSAIKNPPTSESAGRMARFLYALRIAKANYTGRATQQKLLTEYLRRAHKMQWNDRDLQSVCEFLEEPANMHGMRHEFVEVGLQQFPRTPHFHYWAGMRDVGRGSIFCDLDRSIEHLERAISLHDEGDTKLQESDLGEARSALSMLKDAREHSFVGGRSFFRDDYDEDDEDDEDDKHDEDDEHDVAGFDEAFFDHLESTMPPEIRAALEETARKMGLDPHTSLRELLGHTAMADLVEAGDFQEARIDQQADKK